MGDTLIAVGGAFVAAGILARLGRRIGLPICSTVIVFASLFLAIV